ncbi:MAG: porin, partial [Alphaproteobacteria bacterium]
DTFGMGYEAGLRYEGQFNNVGVILGTGYSHLELEEELLGAGNATDDQTAWNVGADFDIGPFGIGAVYVEDDLGELDVDGVAGGAKVEESETWVVGVDYTTGPFKLGASYYDSESFGGTVAEIETQRYSGGVTYTYGPGMTFRGSIGYIEHEATGIGGAGSNDVDATYVTLGTQINF